MKNLSLLIVPMMLTVLGCSRSTEENRSERDILVSVGDSVLFQDEVERKIPGGISADDSLAMFHEIVDSWIETRVLENVARENVVDMERINRLTENYRNRLIVDEYLRKMGDNAPAEIDKKEVAAYYTQYGDSMLLEQPLVKGIYLRIPSTDKEISNIRKWITSAAEEDIDRLEKKGIHDATGYEYFADRWVEWSDIAGQIPYKVEDADLFVKENKIFETSHGGYSYFLHILDFVPSGSKMPQEYAFAYVADILADRRKGEYRKNLKRSIYRNAIKEGKLKKGSYDPMESIR
ncbi:MAG: hypothetical protein K2N05_06155 [Muribaculaceae bacterium]|nr:hypothetical protein [Muribaculaceae bacterium]